MFENLFKLAEAEGLSALEIYTAKSNSTEISIYDQKVEKFEKSDLKGISFRAIYKGKQGTTFTEKYQSSMDLKIINELKTNAELITSSESIIFNEKQEEFKNIKTYYENLESISVQDITKQMLDLELKIKKASDKIEQVSDIGFSLNSSTVEIINSYGVKAKRKTNNYFLYAQIVLKDQNEVETNFNYHIGKELTDFKEAEFIEKLVDEGLAKLHATKLKTSNYPVIIKNTAMNSLLSFIASAVNAEQVLKGLSIFNDKLNSKVFDEKISIVDDPFIEEGLSKIICDDEMVATKVKNVVDSGVLKTFLHNLKTAKELGLEPTGNGFKSSYATSVNVRPTNFYIKPGEKSYDDLIKEMNNGFIITELSGLHAGMNALTMNFSLQKCCW